MKREPTLRPLITSVSVISKSDGNLEVTPVWKHPDSVGVMTRMAAASRLERLVNQYLKRRKLP